MIRQRDRIHFAGQFCIGVPAGDGMRGIERDRYIRNLDAGSASAFLRSADPALIVQEEDIICLLEYRIQIYITIAADRSSDLDRKSVV